MRADAAARRAGAGIPRRVGSPLGVRALRPARAQRGLGARRQGAAVRGQGRFCPPACEGLNRSARRRTLAGGARSLRPPALSVRPGQARPSTVNVTVSWELCWYRYEIDLSDDVPGVRVDAQGYELDELEPAEQRA